MLNQVNTAQELIHQVHLQVPKLDPQKHTQVYSTQLTWLIAGSCVGFSPYSTFM